MTVATKSDSYNNLAGSKVKLRSPKLVGFSLLCVALVVAFVASTMISTVSISPTETIQILLHKIGLYRGAVGWPQTDETIIWQVRVPLAVAATLVGAALGIAGTLFQAILRNPLADPYVIGTSAGAQLGVSMALVLPWQFAILGFGPIQILAFVGALATVLFVYFLARTSGQTPIVTLLLAGFVTSSFLISASTFVMTTGNKIDKVMVWTMGSLDAPDVVQFTLVGPLILGTGLLAFLLAKALDVILLGDEHASHLGVRVEAVKLTAIVLASLLTALAVSLAGIIAFVGLVVPHSARLVFGPGHRLLLPASAIGGAVFLLVANIIARAAIAPAVIPLGVVTAIVGAPFFLYLLRRGRRDYAL